MRSTVSLPNYSISRSSARSAPPWTSLGLSSTLTSKTSSPTMPAISCSTTPPSSSDRERPEPAARRSARPSVAFWAPCASRLGLPRPPQLPARAGTPRSRAPRHRGPGYLQDGRKLGAGLAAALDLPQRSEGQLAHLRQAAKVSAGVLPGFSHCLHVATATLVSIVHTVSRLTRDSATAEAQRASHRQIQFANPKR